MNVETKQSPENFRLYLQQVLVQRCRTNSRYSLRSFARSLQISPSSISRILKGERNVSIDLRKRLGLRLGLGLTEIERFAEDSGVASVRGEVVKTATYKQLALDAFSVISDWYHFAILELIELESFRQDPRWIARALGITVGEVNAAIERLERLQILKTESSGKWINVSGSHTNINSEIKAEAHRKLQRQVLEMAIRALDEVPLERRNQTAMTMAIHTKRLPEAIKRITKFRRELCAFLQQDQSRDQVYQLGISLYPLTHIQNKENKK